MNDKLKHIDDYFKAHLEGYESDSSDNLWRKLGLLLFLKKFGIWIGTGVILGTIIIYYFFMMTVVDNNYSNFTMQTNFSTDDSSVNINNSKENIKQNLAKVNQLEDSIESNTLKSTDQSTQTQVEPFSDNHINTSFAKTEGSDNLTSKLKYSEPNSGFIRPTSPGQQEVNNRDNKITNQTILNQETIAYNPITYYPGKINTRNISTQLSSITSEEKIERKSSLSNKWALDLYVNPIYVVQKHTSENGFEEYTKYRKDSEEPAWSINIGAEINYSIKDFFIQSGLNYTDYSQKYQYSTTSQNIDYYYLIDTTWIWIIDPPFIEPYPISIDSSKVPVYNPITSNISGKNHYQYLEIPLSVGYQHEFKKINLEISTGISYGFFISAKGKIPDASNSSFLDLNDQNDLIQNNINFLLYAGLEYKLSDSWGIIIKPNYTQNLNSTFNSDFPVKQKFITFGVAFGIRIKL